MAPYAQPVAFALVVGAITYLSLIIGELVPKRLALGAPEVVASFVARPMRLLSNLALPAVWFLGASTNGVLRLLRVRPSGEAPVSEQEVEILLEGGARALASSRTRRGTWPAGRCASTARPCAS